MIFLISIVVISIVVTIHYEILHWLAMYIPHSRVILRFRLLFGVFGVLLAHVLEIVVFASAYYLAQLSSDLGSLQGNYTGAFLDCVYFSFTTFSTLGFGDIEPIGKLRFMVGIESLAGLLLIAWSASFLFLLMEKHWVASALRKEDAHQDSRGGREE